MHQTGTIYDATSETVYLTEPEFCDRYKVGRRTAQNWRATGEGPQWVRLGLRQIRYRLSDCEAWAASLTFKSRAAEIQRKRPEPSTPKRTTSPRARTGRG